MRRPSNNPITLPFGSTESPYSATSPHRGTDFSHLPDNRIYAPFSGTVQLVPNNGNDGNGVYMANGNQAHGFLHTSQYLVANGSHVEEGQPIAVMGETGYAFGVHLHWACRVGSTYIDPMTLVTNQKEEEEMVTRDSLQMLWAGFFDRPPMDSEYEQFVGRPLEVVLTTAWQSTEFKQRMDGLRAMWSENQAKKQAYVAYSGPQLFVKQ